MSEVSEADLYDAVAVMALTEFDEASPYEPVEIGQAIGEYFMRLGYTFDEANRAIERLEAMLKSNRRPT